MPISDAEWDSGAHGDGSEAPTTPVGEYEDEKDLIVAFLSENVDNAYTEREIILGVDFGDNASPDTIRETLADIPNEIVDLMGNIVASGMVVDDIDEALEELVEEGTVVSKDVETGSETTTYYRLNTDEA